MIKIARFSVFVLAFFIAGTAFSQSMREELKKVRSAYILTKQLSFEVEAYSYTSKTDKKADLISKGYMKKNNDKYYSNFQDYELMVNGEKAVIIDNKSKAMSYYDYKISKQKVPQTFQVNIDSLILNTDSVVMRPEQDGLKHFTTFSKKGYIKQTEIFVDSKTYFVKHLLYYYVPSTEDYQIDVDRVEIFYKNIQTQVVDESFFTFDKYFKNNKSKFIPTGKYLGYKINYYNTKS